MCFAESVTLGMGVVAESDSVLRLLGQRGLDVRNSSSITASCIASREERGRRELTSVEWFELELSASPAFCEVDLAP